jgi:multidrug efflux pump
MIGIVAWAANHARMVMAIMVMVLGAGAVAYVNLPKEGEPDIEVPAVIITVPFPGISAVDGESMLVKPMEAELADLDGLKTISAFSAEGFAAAVLEFEFGWDKTATMADVRDAMGRAEGNFPEGAQNYSVSEINFSQFPIIIVAVSGDVSERALAARHPRFANPDRGAGFGAGSRNRRRARRNGRGADRPAEAGSL